MKRKNVARIAGAGVAIGSFAGMWFLSPLIPEGTWVGLIALMLGAWAADQIDPVNP